MPTISVSVPDETYARLTAWAASHDQTIEEAIAPAIERLAPGIPTEEDRRRAFENLTRLIQSRADRYPPGFRVDASRESIYDGCDE